MARRAARNCTRPGCHGVVRDNKCSVCGPTSKHKRDARATAAQRGYDARWRKVRRMKLARQPLCEACLEHGHTVAATDVHHIVAKRRGGGDRDANLQSLCHSCHSKLTAQGA